MTPIERAIADLKRMESDLARLKVQMTALQSRIAKAEAYVEMAAFYETDAAQAENLRQRASGVAVNAVRTVIEILNEKGEAMQTRQLLKALEERGQLIGGKDPVANLSGFLSRSDSLRSSRAHGWGLAEWGHPPDEGQAAPSESDNPFRNPEKVPMAPAGYELDDEVPF